MVDVEVEEEHDDRPPEGTSAGAASIHASRDVTSRPCVIDAEVKQEPKVVDLRARAQGLHRSTDLSPQPFRVVDVEVEEKTMMDVHLRPEAQELHRSTIRRSEFMAFLLKTLNCKKSRTMST